MNQIPGKESTLAFSWLRRSVVEDEDFLQIKSAANIEERKKWVVMNLLKNFKGLQ
jgi:hypothetical protein